MILQGKGLIVPDTHEKVPKLKRILEKYGTDVDWVLFLSDFMDSFAGLTKYTYEMCKWLADNIANPKYHFVWGNHDIHYAFPWGALRCSGYTSEKHQVVNHYLTQEHWKKFRLLHWIMGPSIDHHGQHDYVLWAEGQPFSGSREWMVSHAGLHPTLLHPMHGFDKDALAEMERMVLSDLQFGVIAPWLEAGQGRGGPARVGGIDWLDWNTEFVPIDGLNQIVGHTHGLIPRIKQTEKSMNICIDSNLNHVLLVDTDKQVMLDIQETN